MSFVVIFDMDGVIFDSERLIADLWKEVAKENAEDETPVLPGGDLYPAGIIE